MPAKKDKSLNQSQVEESKASAALKQTSFAKKSRDQSADEPKVNKSKSKSPAPEKAQPQSPKKAKAKPEPVEETKEAPKASVASKAAKAKKSALEDKPERDLGPMPKKVSNLFMLFSSSRYKELKAKDDSVKLTDANKQSAELYANWKDEDKAHWQKKQDEAQKIYEARIAEREKKGYFTFEDGTKSTDPANKDKVKAPSKDKKDKKDKDKKNKDAAASEDDEVKPKRATSAYTAFVTSFKLPEDAAKGDKFKLAAEAWGVLSSEGKLPFEKIAAEDKERKAKQDAHLKEHGWFRLDDGTKSNEVTVPKKVKRASKKVADDNDDGPDVKEAPKKERKAIVRDKSKEKKSEAATAKQGKKQ